MTVTYQGDTIEAAFNPRFFIDAAMMIDDKQLILNIISNDKPCLIEGIEDKSYTNVIMPMRV